MAGREVDEPDAPIETSLDQILAYIRSHWEKVTERNRAETDSYLDCKVRMSHLHWCLIVLAAPFKCIGWCVCVCVWVGMQEAQCVSSRLSPEEEQVEALKAECNDTGCKIQSLQAETESIRALVNQSIT